MKINCFSFPSLSRRLSGKITTREPLDREAKEVHELVLEARDQGTPSRAARVPMKVTVLDVNDNSPEIVDPQGDVVSVREEQPSGTEVAKVRALDTDFGENASVIYSILKGRNVSFNNIMVVIIPKETFLRETSY